MAEQVPGAGVAVVPCAAEGAPGAGVRALAAGWDVLQRGGWSGPVLPPIDEVPDVHAVATTVATPMVTAGHRTRRSRLRR